MTESHFWASPNKKRRRATHLSPYAPPYRHPERSRGIFIALPQFACMRSHTNDTLVLPFSSFSHPRFTGLQEGSLRFGPHDTQERWIVSHPFSYRCIELCLSEALYPAPLARRFHIFMRRTTISHFSFKRGFHPQSRGRAAPWAHPAPFNPSPRSRPSPFSSAADSLPFLHSRRTWRGSSRPCRSIP